MLMGMFIAYPLDAMFNFSSLEVYPNISAWGLVARFDMTGKS